MARRLRTKKGRRIYARRKAVAEPPFGQIKQARGFRQLLLRGLEKAREFAESFHFEITDEYRELIDRFRFGGN